MNLQNRIEVLADLGNYLKKNNENWVASKTKATAQNAWFINPFIERAVQNISEQYLSKELLHQWTAAYPLDNISDPKTIGIVMAGNIPLVGFHDFLSVFISGHHQIIKCSSKDNVLLPHLIQYLHEQFPATQEKIKIADTLLHCDAYIATGSQQSAQHFKQYFKKYPHIIRDQKTSVAILKGNESTDTLRLLADDIHLYFGLGCRNVTKIYVPKDYDFITLLNSFNSYLFLKDFHKYQNNYDFQLSLALLNNQQYMTNGSTLLIENEGFFSPISVVYFQYYDSYKLVVEDVQQNPAIQCIVGEDFTDFGKAQSPSLDDFADGINTLDFLCSC